MMSKAVGLLMAECDVHFIGCFRDNLLHWSNLVLLDLSLPIWPNATGSSILA